MGRPRTTYPITVTAVASAIAGPVEVGVDGEVMGYFEVFNESAVDIEISTDPSFTFGRGIKVRAGTSYYQDKNPDPYEWYALRATAGNADVRVHDSRRPKRSRG